MCAWLPSPWAVCHLDGCQLNGSISLVELILKDAICTEGQSEIPRVLPKRRILLVHNKHHPLSIIEFDCFLQTKDLPQHRLISSRCRSQPGCNGTRSLPMSMSTSLPIVWMRKHRHLHPEAVTKLREDELAVMCPRSSALSGS